MTIIFFIAIGLAFFFAFWNGFTDAAYAISTVVATRVLSPVKAVLLSAVGNFTGLLFGTAVAQTIGKGIVEGSVVNPPFILAVLVGGMLWDVSTWFFGLPISESHVLVGALIGAGLVAGGAAAVKFSSIFDKVIVPMVTSPILAFFFAFLLVGLVIRLFARVSAKKTNRVFRGLQMVSSFMFSVSHGANDAQKAMGIITILLFQQGFLKTFSVPLWVMLVSYFCISLGTLFGGWRIVKTMATGITKLRPYQGFCAEAAGAIILSGTALVGFPVSTTHAISGAIMGVGASRRFSAVRWVTARKIVWAWVLTMPVSAIAAGLIYFIIKQFL
jgi:PiT family inorganic phosphate transporter